MDRDEFLKKAEAAPYFEVGSRVAPNTLWMVADPKCPYCHAAWSHIQSMVFDKKLKVRVILINALQGSEPFAREILASPDPARRWIVSNGGVNIEPTVDPNSKEYQDSAKYLTMNMDFAKSFGIDRTPFLGYVGPDGRFYSTLGLPADLDSFLAATGAISKK
jgi:protein-disulfide isomerase